MVLTLQSEGQKTRVEDLGDKKYTQLNFNLDNFFSVFIV